MVGNDCKMIGLHHMFFGSALVSSDIVSDLSSDEVAGDGKDFEVVE